jgi:hypothetical protein
VRIIPRFTESKWIYIGEEVLGLYNATLFLPPPLLPGPCPPKPLQKQILSKLLTQPPSTISTHVSCALMQIRRPQTHHRHLSPSLHRAEHSYLTTLNSPENRGLFF